MRNKAYLAGIAGKQMQQSGQKAGNAPPEERTSPKPCTLRHLHSVDTTTAPKREPHRKPLQPSKIKYILNFAPFGLPISRGNTKHPQKFIHFCPFLLKICPDRLKIDDRREGRQAGRKPLSICRKGRKEGTPPHLQSDKYISSP